MAVDSVETLSMPLNPERAWGAEVGQEHLMTCQLDAGENRGRGKDDGTERAESGTGGQRVSLTREVFDNLVVSRLT